ncbi:MAG TPA: hypothetical protein VLA99_01445 [Nitrospiraceae bacterium]|uniref:Uncharacterized protein n=1 Tax=Nitrospira tepida TaxID=2973512 RepID=A0AA86TAU5_9BACT|nr:hypothetical protein [Nitrospira tepida]CAI4033558.1 hypothetical protein DNFV4_03999 [Nitrospira tepida]HSE57344.1 hypothetical protein [Nitrospiraceae bacterium]
MSWGYWGIVAGLLTMVGLFFVCMAILYPAEKESSRLSSDLSQSTEPATQGHIRSRHAA